MPGKTTSPFPMYAVYVYEDKIYKVIEVESCAGCDVFTNGDVCHFSPQECVSKSGQRIGFSLLGKTNELWLKIEDCLPQDFQPVLAYCEQGNGDNSVLCFAYRNMGKWYEISTDKEQVGVTHWRVPPAPPGL